jgi:hypothetical protein
MYKGWAIKSNRCTATFNDLRDFLLLALREVFLRRATRLHSGTSICLQFIDDLCSKIHFLEFLLFADDLKIFLVMKPAEDCKVLHVQSDIDSVQKWCNENYMKINIFKTNINSFTRKANSVHFNYFRGDLLIVRTGRVEDLGVVLDSKLHFRRHVGYVHSQAQKLLKLIRFITYNFSSLDSLKLLYITLIRSKFEYASVVRNNNTSSDSKKLEST